MVDQPLNGDFKTVYQGVEQETKGVAEQLEKDLATKPELLLIQDQLNSYLFTTTQKLIERKRRTNEVRPRDEALIYLIPRLFNECYAGNRLVRIGMPLQAIELLRSALEVVGLAILVLEDEQTAERWLKGKKISPAEVRSEIEIRCRSKGSL